MNNRMEKQINEGILGPVVQWKCRIGGRRVKTLLPLTAALLAANLWGQLKTNQYAKPPAVVIEPVILRITGSDPQKIVRPQGPFVLYIENRLPGHTAHFSFALDKANGAELVGLNTTVSHAIASIFLDPLPGNYRLTIQTTGATPNGWSLPIQITD